MDLARYADLFRTESREHLAEIDAALLILEHQGDLQQVATLFRSTHTIKGMAASMGYRGVEQYSHALESLLDALRSGARSLDADLITLLFEGTDALAQSVDDAVEGRADAMSERASALLQRLSNAADPTIGDVFPAVVLKESALQSEPSAAATRADVAPASVPATAPERLPDESGLRIVEVRLMPDTELKGVRALMVLSRLEKLGAARSVEPPQQSWSADAFDGAFIVTLETRERDDVLEKAARSAGDVARFAIRAPATNGGSRDVMRHVRIDLRRLDTLLDLVGELVITRDRLVRTVEPVCEGGQHRALAGAVHDAVRLVSALQEEVLRTRMVPVGQVFDRFPRMVRDIARDLGKEITFVTEGRDIELDRSLLDAIGDPIVHLLRNAVDHGIETAETRRAVGKLPAGRLILRAARDRAAVVVQVEDDGRGIDRKAVLERARADGFVDADASTLSDDDLLRLVSKAGFSTARSVTAVSGRGVGIDVVASRVRALGGTLQLRSQAGIGTTFTLRLPVTLAIVRALLVRAGDESYALPTAHVLEALEYDPACLVTLRGREAVTLRDDVIPLVRLRERFGLSRGDARGSHLVMVEASGRRAAVLVDALIGQQDIVVKPYDVVRGAETLFTGATILGDGTPALIVDLGGFT